MAKSSSKRLNHGPLVLFTNSATPITSRERERDSMERQELLFNVFWHSCLSVAGSNKQLLQQEKGLGEERKICTEK